MGGTLQLVEKPLFRRIRPSIGRGARGGGSPPRVGSNALNALLGKAFSERSEDFSAVERRKSNGIFSGCRKSPWTFSDSLKRAAHQGGTLGGGSEDRLLLFGADQVGQGYAVQIVVDELVSSLHMGRVRQSSARSQLRLSSPGQPTGASPPSVRRRMLPTVYSSGERVRR